MWDEPESGEPVEEYRLSLLPVVADATTNSFNNVPSWQAERFFDITYVLEYLGAEFTVQVRAGNYVGFSPWTEKQTFAAPATSSTTSASSTTSTSTSTTAA